MPVLIGGSPSTGSSLLRQILNRHSEIYCGPETQLFTHPQLFEKWDKSKYQLLGKPLLTSPDIHLTRGGNLIGEEQGWSLPDINTLLDKSIDFKVFCDTYFARSASLYGKQIWIDKTPSNVLSFDAFLKTWENGTVVHIVRDPLDIVASLIERGLPLFLAVSRFLFNTAHALISKDNSNYLIIRYEALVASPEEALDPILKRVQCSFQSGMLEAGNPQMTEVHQMSGWRSSEIDKPNQRSIGRFKSLTEKAQSDIITSFSILRINPDYARKHGLPYLDAMSISESLGYSIPELKIDAKREVMSRLSSEQRRYRQNCLRERRLFFERERPVVFAGN